MLRALSLSLLALTSVDALGTSPTVLFSPNGGVREAVLAEVSGARCSLDIAMYSYSDKTIWDAMVERARSGVSVRLILNKAAFSPSVSSCPLCEAAEEAGVDIRYVNPTMHHKFAIVDQDCEGEPRLMTGSGNWSRSSPQNYDEDFVLFRGRTTELEAFSEEFSFIWNHSQSFGTGPEPADVAAVARVPFLNAFFTSHNLEPRKTSRGWSFRRADGEGRVGRVLVEAIDTAEKSIDMAAAHFRRFDVYEALLRAAERGVKVRLVLDAQELYPVRGGCSSGLAERETELEECLEKVAPNADVRYKMYSPSYNPRGAKLLHSKYMVVDGAHVFTGSFNLSITSETANFENLVRIDDAATGAAYIENFDKIFNYGGARIEGILTKVQQEGGHGPCAFDPISVPASEVWRLRRAYAPGACSAAR